MKLNQFIEKLDSIRNYAHQISTKDRFLDNLSADGYKEVLYIKFEEDKRTVFGHPIVTTTISGQSICFTATGMAIGSYTETLLKVTIKTEEEQFYTYSNLLNEHQRLYLEMIISDGSTTSGELLKLGP